MHGTKLFGFMRVFFLFPLFTSLRSAFIPEKIRTMAISVIDLIS